MSTHVPPPAARPIERETRIDVIRGVAILVILINHLTQVAEFGGLRGWMIATPSRYGWSSAAELFVIMSGYMVGLVYLPRPRPAARIWRRAATLWLYDAVLLAILLPLALATTPPEQAFWRFDRFVDAPAAATWRFVTLQEAPRLLDVLQMYIALMLFAPVAMAVQRRSPRALIALSAGLYLLAQALTIRHLAAHPDAAAEGVLNLMSWQLLFFVPMALGAAGAHKPLFAWLERRPGVLVALVALFAAAAVIRQWQTDGTIPQPEWLTGRHGLHVLRLSHAILVLLLYASALSVASPRVLRSAPVRAVGTVGRHSLDCFVGGVVLTYLLGAALLRLPGGHATYYLFTALGVAFTVLLARYRDARRTRWLVPAAATA